MKLVSNIKEIKLLQVKLDPVSEEIEFTGDSKKEIVSQIRSSISKVSDSKKDDSLKKIYISTDIDFEQDSKEIGSLEVTMTVEVYLTDSAKVNFKENVTNNKNFSNNFGDEISEISEPYFREIVGYVTRMAHIPFPMLPYRMWEKKDEP